MKRNNQKQGMVDISEKAVTKRTARACAKIRMGKEAFGILLSQGSPKGNVFETAKVAGIMAAKSTSNLIPLCHPLALDKVNVSFELDKTNSVVSVCSQVICQGRTGVEMEALTAACVAALTIYDMMKWATKTMRISDVKLLYKSGGKDGIFQRKP